MSRAVSQRASETRARRVTTTTRPHHRGLSLAVPETRRGWQRWRARLRSLHSSRHSLSKTPNSDSAPSPTSSNTPQVSQQSASPRSRLYVRPLTGWTHRAEGRRLAQAAGAGHRQTRRALQGPERRQRPRRHSPPVQDPRRQPRKGKDGKTQSVGPLAALAHDAPTG